MQESCRLVAQHNTKEMINEMMKVDPIVGRKCLLMF